MLISVAGAALIAVAHPVDSSVVVVRHQQRAVLHDQNVGRASDVVVVIEKAGDERLHRVEAAVRLELHEHEIAARFLGAVP